MKYALGHIFYVLTWLCMAIALWSIDRRMEDMQDMYDKDVEVLQIELSDRSYWWTKYNGDLLLFQGDLQEENRRLRTEVEILSKIWWLQKIWDYFYFWLLGE